MNSKKDSFIQTAQFNNSQSPSCVSEPKMVVSKRPPVTKTKKSVSFKNIPDSSPSNKENLKYRALLLQTTKASIIVTEPNDSSPKNRTSLESLPNIQTPLKSILKKNCSSNELEDQNSNSRSISSSTLQVPKYPIQTRKYGTRSDRTIKRSKSKFHKSSRDNFKCELTKFWSKNHPIRKIDTFSQTFIYKKSDFRIKRNNAFKSGLGYSYFKAMNKKTGKRVIIKVYNKDEVRKYGLEKCIHTEIILHENLKSSHNILSIIATFESDEELFIVYQNFSSFVDLNKNVGTDFDQKYLLSQVLLGLMEINSLGYSVGYIDTNNLVKINDYELRLFDLNYLTKHNRTVKNTQIKNELAIKPPELDLGKVFSRSDV